MSVPALHLTGDEDADRLLATDGLALLIGMLLDQQVPMEWAFAGPKRLSERLGGHLDAATIAAMEPGRLEAAFKEKPALHRFPGSMATRTAALCRHLVERYDGRAEALWEGLADGDELLRRLRDLPGFGAEKARIFVALLGKRLGVRPPGWERAAGPFADGQPRSVADIDSPAALEAVRAFKRARKAEGKGKAD